MTAQRLHPISLAIACLALAAGYGFSGSIGWALIFPGLGLAGWSAIRWLKLPLGNFLFIVFISAAGFGAASGFTPLLMLVSILATLAFWDIDAFLLRLALVETSPTTQILEQKHLRRLLTVVAIGLLLGGVGLVIKINFNLAWAVILGIIILVGIRLGIQALHANHDSQ